MADWEAFMLTTTERLQACPHRRDTGGRGDFEQLFLTCARRSRLLSGAIGTMKAITSLVRRNAEHVREWWRRRATRLALQSLDDRTLHDIGLPRSEIEALVHHVECWNASR
jgi:uncharacterized protein YjiS (DUF1127 family)